MFKKLINEAIFEVELETNSPLLIQGKENGNLNPTAVDTSYIKTNKDGHLVPYIPGSSLKGVFRSYAESILEASCDIVGKNREYTRDGKRKKCLSQKDSSYKDKDGKARYTESCMVCKLYGSDVLKSRITFSNAYPIEECKIETAGLTAIDRVKGGAKSGALRDIEYVGYGVFKGKISLKNFEPYQVKLVLDSLMALEMGEIHLGSYTSKGFGELNVKSLDLAIRYYGKAIDGYENKGFYSEKVIQGKDEVEAFGQKLSYKEVNIWENLIVL